MEENFIKAPLRVKLFRDRFPNTPLPPEPVLTRWDSDNSVNDPNYELEKPERKTESKMILKTAVTIFYIRQSRTEYTEIPPSTSITIDTSYKDTYQDKTLQDNLQNVDSTNVEKIVTTTQHESRVIDETGTKKEKKIIKQNSSSLYLSILQFVYEDNSSLVIVLPRLESLFLFTDATSKISVLFFNHKQEAQLIRDTLKFWNLEDFPYEKERKTGAFILKAAKFIAIWYPAIGVITSFSVLLGPLLSGEYVLPLSTYVPAYPPYWLLYVIEDFSFIIVLIGVASFDVLLGTLVLMVVIQWKMLNREVKRILESTAVTDEERYLLKNDIKKCVDHHNFLIDYVERLNGTVWYANIIFIFLSVITYCVEMFVIVKRPIGGDFSTRLTLLIEYTNEFLLFYVIPGQLMTNEGEQTQDFAYSSKWYEHSVDIKKPFLKMVTYISRKPVTVHAGNLIDFNFLCAHTVFKTVFSYYMFLNTISEGP
uniref:Odorant receptor n=1 Tax=Diabrotica virgifera virgifera TaxID=50390 RepID=A0A6P7H0V5_DIAVI